MILSERINIRPVDENDISFLIKMRNDIELQSLLLSVPKGTSYFNIQDWLNRIKNSGLIFIISLRDSNKAIGYIQVEFTDVCQKVGLLGILIDRDYQDKRYGKETILVFKEYLKNILGIKKLLLYVDEENKIGMSLYKKVGFRVVGILKNHVVINAKDIDVVLMEIVL
jgi:RimJ/RimL family protein N-acetyltransferase